MIPVSVRILTVGGAPSLGLTKKFKETRTEVLIQEERREGEKEKETGKER